MLQCIEALTAKLKRYIRRWRMRAILAMLTLLATVANASAQPTPTDVWFVAMPQDSSGQVQAVVFMDVSRITITNGSLRRGWTTAYVSPDAVESLEGVSLMQSFKEFDCAQGLFRDLQMDATYRDHRGTRTFGATDWERPVPHSSGETAFRFACASEAERLASDTFYRLEGVSPERAAQAVFDAPDDHGTPR